VRRRKGGKDPKKPMTFMSVQEKKGERMGGGKKFLLTERKEKGQSEEAF